MYAYLNSIFIHLNAKLSTSVIISCKRADVIKNMYYSNFMKFVLSFIK